MKAKGTEFIWLYAFSFFCTWVLFWLDYHGEISFTSYLVWRMSDIGYWAMAGIISVPVFIFFSILYLVVNFAERMLLKAFRHLRKQAAN